jgi:hypothetical protein
MTGTPAIKTECPAPAALQHGQVRRGRFSEGLRAELGRGPAPVTTVVPG